MNKIIKRILFFIENNKKTKTILKLFLFLMVGAHITNLSLVQNKIHYAPELPDKTSGNIIPYTLSSQKIVYITEFQNFTISWGNAIMVLLVISIIIVHNNFNKNR